MRGQVFTLGLCTAFDGITPADAGTSISTVFFRLLSEDHPRGCGDKTSYSVTDAGALGSPPRMRGQGYNLANLDNKPRITPADAGTSTT